MLSAWHFFIGGALLATVAGAVEGFPSITGRPASWHLLTLLAPAETATAFVVWSQETGGARWISWAFLVPVSP